MPIYDKEEGLKVGLNPDLLKNLLRLNLKFKALRLLKILDLVIIVKASKSFSLPLEIKSQLGKDLWVWSKDSVGYAI